MTWVPSRGTAPLTIDRGQPVLRSSSPRSVSSAEARSHPARAGAAKSLEKENIMEFDVSPMSKTAVTRLFIGGVVTIVAGAVLLLGAVWGAFASGAIAFGGPVLVEVHGGSSAW